MEIFENWKSLLKINKSTWSRSHSPLCSLERCTEVLFVFGIRVTKFLWEGPQENDREKKQRHIEKTWSLYICSSACKARKKLSSGGFRHRVQRSREGDGAEEPRRRQSFQAPRLFSLEWDAKGDAHNIYTAGLGSTHVFEVLTVRRGKITKCQNQQFDQVRFLSTLGHNSGH